MGFWTHDVRSELLLGDTREGFIPNMHMCEHLFVHKEREREKERGAKHFQITHTLAQIAHKDTQVHSS